jgi:hypothetical protein
MDINRIRNIDKRCTAIAGKNCILSSILNITPQPINFHLKGWGLRCNKYMLKQLNSIQVVNSAKTMMEKNDFGLSLFLYD